MWAKAKVTEEILKLLMESEERVRDITTKLEQEKAKNV